MSRGTERENWVSFALMDLLCGNFRSLACHFAIFNFLISWWILAAF
jgi:hypothetical protein